MVPGSIVPNLESYVLGNDTAAFERLLQTGWRIATNIGVETYGKTSTLDVQVLACGYIVESRWYIGVGLSFLVLSISVFLYRIVKPTKLGPIRTNSFISFVATTDRNFYETLITTDLSRSQKDLIIRDLGPMRVKYDQLKLRVQGV